MINEPLISGSVRARLKSLRLLTRGNPSSQGMGYHQGRSRGVGLEFAQYRAYEPGDEPRQIDWKLYARSDRFFVRDSTRDAPLTVWLLIDATSSMSQADAVSPHQTKLEAAKRLAACVAELALQQGDRFGLVTLGGAAIKILAPGSSLRHRDQLWVDLHRLQASGSLPPEEALRPLWERIEPSALVVLLSDAFDEGLVRFAEQLAGARRELVSIQILTAEERDFPFSGGYRFREPETGESRRVDAESVRSEFVTRFARARKELSQRMSACGARHVEYFLDVPFEVPLQKLFGPRRGESGP